MEPITRSEMLMDGQYVEPKTRKEMILAGEDLEPVTREEYFLKKYRHSGGDVDVVQLTATENKVYAAPEGKAYSPVSVNVPEKKLTTLNADENKTYSPPSGYDGFSEVEVYVPYVTQGTTINENGDYTPPAGVDGFGRVIVDVPTPPPSLQSLTASHNGYFLPSSGYVGFSEVNVDVALPQNAYLLESQKDDVVTIQHGAEFDMPKLIASIEPYQSGSGDPSPTNIRPISGWTACNVVRSGENLFDKATITENKIINNTTGEETVSYGRFSSDYIKVNPSTDYYASNVIKSAQWYCVFYYDKNKNYLSCGELSSTGDTASGVVTTPSGCNYVRLVGVTTYKDDVSFVVGNQAPSSYSAYIGDTYTINFVDGSSPLTVYGGTLDVLSGVLTVDRRMVDLGTLTWGKSSTEATVLYTSITGKKTSVSPMICDRYKYVRDKGFVLDFGSVSDSSNESYVGTTFIRNNDFAGKTAVECATLLSGTQLVYELETPQTYQLTPTEVKSLLGVNNIFADTGEVDVQIWTKEV